MCTTVRVRAEYGSRLERTVEEENGEDAGPPGGMRVARCFCSPSYVSLLSNKWVLYEAGWYSYCCFCRRPSIPLAHSNSHGCVRRTGGFYYGAIRPVRVAAHVCACVSTLGNSNLSSIFFDLCEGEGVCVCALARRSSRFWLRASVAANGDYVLRQRTARERG